LILAPGREGADWLSLEAKRLNLTMHNNPVDIGVRVEVPLAVMEELSNVLYEAKLEFLFKSFDDRVRTFCMCPGGEVIMESSGGCDPIVLLSHFGSLLPTASIWLDWQIFLVVGYWCSVWAI